MTISNESTMAEMLAGNRELEHTIRVMQETINSLEAKIAKMKNPPKTSITTLLWECLTRMERVYDLTYYEGPLLTLFTHAENGKTDFYLMNWTDNTETGTVWLVIPVDGETLFDYVNGRKTLLELETNPLGGMLYVLTISDVPGSESGELQTTDVQGPVLPADLPDYFFAQEGTYYSQHEHKLRKED